MRQKIMVVDDEPDLTRQVAHHLEREGFDPICTANGTEALQEIKRGEIALMILDVMMPGEDGFQVCRRLREQSKTASLRTYCNSPGSNRGSIRCVLFKSTKRTH